MRSTDKLRNVLSALHEYQTDSRAVLLVKQAACGVSFFVDDKYCSSQQFIQSTYHVIPAIRTLFRTFGKFGMPGHILRDVCSGMFRTLKGMTLHRAFARHIEYSQWSN